IVAPIQYDAQSLLPPACGEIYDVADMFRGQSSLEMAFIVASVTIVAPICEEFFFRGIFFQGLRAHGGPAMRAVLLSAVVFSMFHLDPVGFFARVELGVLFGWLLVRTGSLWPAILAHTANNLVSMVLFFAERHLEMPEQPAAREQAKGILMLVILGGAVLWALLAATRRFPALLGPPRSREDLKAPEASVPLEPAPQLLRLAVPWVLAAVLSLGAYKALDPLGIQLSRIDRDFPLRSVPKDAPDALHAERAALFELRVRARRGEIPLGEYAQERARQSKQKRNDVR
ncbi:MAG TPA: CPBP family intramembrane glutamic endopeptidase, partial [Archangium sp.]|nr:CPBP family intramembrane glutamic endopeptidase [Archangium sp.]